MTYLRGTTFNEQAVAAELTLAGVQQWPEQADAPSYIQGFLRSARQTFAPAAVRTFFVELNAKDRLLHQFGWFLLLSVPAFAVLSYLDPGAAKFANPWFKPIKFAISFTTFVWTVSLFLEWMRLSTRLIHRVRQTMTASIVV